MIGFICIGFYPVLICENLWLKKIKINFARLLIVSELYGGSFGSDTSYLIFVLNINVLPVFY
jgi:hypothetical protein